ncbi:MAG TPA: hypothetical protein VFW66_07725 [Gemmatimonadales bacterium]|nr:hypothetical protein [Gemmatimonadales bacterium]
MAELKRRLAAAALLAGLAGCSHGYASARRPAPEPDRGRTYAASLGVPPGQLPPPGMCRVWVPGRPPGHQPRPRDCAGIDETAPAGSWVLLRPSQNRRIVKVRMVDERRAGIVVRVRIFDVASGGFLREEPV